MAIGLGARDRLGRHHATGAGAVVDHHRLAELAGQLLGHDAGSQVAHAAGAERHHDAQALGREGGLCRGGQGHQTHGGSRQGGTEHGAATESQECRHVIYPTN